MTRISVLGSTGSIGTQTLQVARARDYRVAGLAAFANSEVLIRQMLEFRPELVACSPAIHAQVQAAAPEGTAVTADANAASAVARLEVDAVVAAIPGMAGLAPLRSALLAGRRVALAGKEAMVIAAPLIRALCRAHGGSIIPVDSEHSAVFQCLVGEDMGSVQSIIITASGGPFLRSPPKLDGVTPTQALAHPNFSMGAKVTIDSATLFNKGLEVLEAEGLFEVPLDAIEVLIHPQQLVHGAVRFRDGSIKAQVGPHDMRLPIQYGIEYPARPTMDTQPLPLAGTWEFMQPDTDRFPALALAFEAGRRGGYARAYINAADEVAVPAFLEGRIPFTAIPRVLEGVLDAAPTGRPDWQQLAEADREARALAADLTESMGRVA